MKKLSIWMSLSGAVMALTEMKDAMQNLTQLHIIFYALLAAGYIGLLVFEILDSEERTKEKILNDAKVLNLQPDDKIVFRFNARAIRKKDIEKCIKVLNDTFKGHEILAVADSMNISTAREGREKNETAETEAKD